CLRTLAHTVRLDLEGDLLAVDQRTQARTLNCGDVDENVLRAVVRRDKSEAFGCIEEFYGAGLGHKGKLLFPFVSCCALRRVVIVESLRRGKVVCNGPVSGSANARTVLTS